MRFVVGVCLLHCSYWMDDTRRLWLAVNIRLQDLVTLKFPSLPLDFPSKTQRVLLLLSDFFFWTKPVWTWGSENTSA